ncbi:MAG: methyltransferase domain-containing protein [Bacillota bacterium]|nr:methyltransferase domain-containing protein [Bacillota bacterium]
MNLEYLKEIWKKEEKHSFKGWDFSYIDSRSKEEALPWDYKKIVESYISDDKVMLDMGTGGGEFLLSINPSVGKTYATEAYLPNIELSRQTLAPHGIEVRAVQDDCKLPFKDNFFDLIINRHEAYYLSEVNRILKPGGIFITQQIGENNNRELSSFLLDKYPEIERLPENLKEALEGAKGFGWNIIKKEEHFPKIYFYDIGALVYYAKIIQWEFPEFSVERCFSKLKSLQQKLEKQGYVDTIGHRYLIIARKP